MHHSLILTRSEAFSALGLFLIVGAVLLYVLAIGLRKRQLLGRPGGIPLALKADEDNWALGVGRFAGNGLDWYGALRPGRRPTRTLLRSQLEITGQRRRRPSEPMLAPDSVVVECLVDGERMSLALSQAAVTGFLSWLESSPPRS